jgi:acyl carrier protein
MADYKQQLRAYIAENFIVSATTKLSDSDSLLDNGVVDSTGFIELISFLEEHFGIQVKDAEMVPENLDSIDHLDAYLGRKLGSA